MGANPSAYDMDEEVRRFESSVKAGAEFAVTQPIFDLDSLEVFLKFGIPVIAGIRPLASIRDTEYVVNELRVPVPEPYMERMRSAESAEAARIEGRGNRERNGPAPPSSGGWSSVEYAVRATSDGHRCSTSD